MQFWIKIDSSLVNSYFTVRKDYHKMIIFVVAILFILLVVYLWITPYRSALKHIPEPASWPLVGHSPTFFTSSDHITMYEKWNEEFRSHGLYKVRHVAIGWEFVMISKSEWAKEILSRTDKFERDGFLQIIFPKLGDSILVATGEEHRFQKRVLAKAFSLLHVKKYTPVFDKHANTLVQLWDAKARGNVAGETIDVKSYMNNFSFDVISDIAFGHNAHAQINEANPFVTAFKQTVDGLANFQKRVLRNVCPFIKYLPFGVGKMLEYEADTIMQKIIQDRKQKILNDKLTDFEEQDLLSIMIGTTDEATGKSFSDRLIKDSCFTFLFAGFETVSTALPLILYHLCKHPDMQERARKEIQNVFDDENDDPLSNELMEQLEYTNAFIKESLRFFPPAPLNARKSMVDCQFGAYHIPKGTNLVMLVYPTNFDEERFDYANQFLPERYLEGSSVKAGNTLTFGYGPYNCIGKNFALQELRVSIVRLLQHFKFSIDAENDQFSRRPVLTVKLFPALRIRVQNLKSV